MEIDVAAKFLEAARVVQRVPRNGLIPFPYATDNHQEKNGRFLVEHGGARMFIEAELTAQTLGEEITKLINNTKQQQELAANIGSLARPHATETIVEHCLDMI